MSRNSWCFTVKYSNLEVLEGLSFGSGELSGMRYSEWVNGVSCSAIEW